MSYIQLFGVYCKQFYHNLDKTLKKYCSLYADATHRVFVFFFFLLAILMIFTMFEENGNKIIKMIENTKLYT